MYFIDKSTLPDFDLLPGFTGKMIHTETMTIIDFTIEAGAELPLHQHPHEQVSTLVSGEFEFEVGGELHRCKAGMVTAIPGNVPHRGRALTDCRIIDVFTPVREDYRAKLG